MFCVPSPRLTCLLLSPFFIVQCLSPLCLAWPSNRYHHCSLIWRFDLAVCMYCLTDYHTFCIASTGVIFLLSGVHPQKGPLVRAHWWSSLCFWWPELYFPCLREYCLWALNSRLTVKLSECQRYYVTVFWIWLLLSRSWWLVWLLLLL